jgi:hypothetical protein
MARPFSSSGYQRLSATVLVHNGEEGPPAITSIIVATSLWGEPARKIYCARASARQSHVPRTLMLEPNVKEQTQ